MFSKILVICSVVAAAAAITPGYLDGAYALGAQSEQTVRGFGGLSSVSKQHKAVDGPYSSVRKTDIRVTNDGAYAHPVAAYGHGAYAAPAFAHHGYAAGPVATYGHGAYAAPAFAHHGYAAGPVATYGHGAYAAPALAHPGYAAGPVVAKTHVQSGLGYSFSPATAVAHHTFSGLGIHYGY